MRRALERLTTERLFRLGPLFVSTLSGSAFAEDRVVIDACPEVERARIERLLAVELESRGDGLPPSVEAITIACLPDGVLIEVKGPEEDAVRVLEGEETRGEVGARVVVLTAVELVREVETQHEPAPAEAPPSESAPQHHPPTTRVLVGLEVLSFSLDDPLVGPELSLELLHFAPFYLRAGIQGSFGAESLDPGRVATSLLGGRIEGGMRLVPGAFGVGWGLGYRAGYARISGKASSAESVSGTVSGAWAGPYLALSSDTRLGETLIFKAGAELGYVQVPVHGQVIGDDDVSVSGAWLGLGVALGGAF